MIDLPAELVEAFARKIYQQEVPDSYHNFYLKWLRFYLDFCPNQAKTGNYFPGNTSHRKKVCHQPADCDYYDGYDGRPVHLCLQPNVELSCAPPKFTARTLRAQASSVAFVSCH